MGWKKSGRRLAPSRYGRVLLYTTLNKKEDWFTALIIKDLKKSDSGEYTFTVKQGPAVTKVTRSLVVLSIQGQFHKKSPSFLRAMIKLKISFLKRRVYLPQLFSTTSPVKFIGRTFLLTEQRKYKP